MQGLGILVGVCAINLRRSSSDLLEWDCCLFSALRFLFSVLRVISAFLQVVLNLFLKRNMLQMNRSLKRLISPGRFFLSAPIVCLLHFRSHRLCSSGSVTQWVYFSWGNHTLHFILLAPTIFFTILAGGETAILKATGQLRALAMQASLLAILLLLVSVPVYWIFGERGILPVLFILAFMQWALNFRYSRRVVRWGVNMRK